ncbi:carboxy methyl transferase for protein phosphatase 2A [Sorochytrium milnesiophthora]
MDDSAVKHTNTDAAECKLSAVTLGYLTDDFVGHFVRAGPATKKQPIINRGTYARTKAIDLVVEAFLRKRQQSTPAQILSIGAGSDTRFFNLKASDSSRLDGVRYFEVDFEDIVLSKISTMRKHKLTKHLGNVHYGRGGMELYSDEYTLVSGDLRCWTSQVAPRLLERGFDAHIPTLLLSECVFVYLPPETTAEILSWMTTYCSTALCVSYEQIGPSDGFGSTMINNLRARGVELPGIHAYPALEDQRRRLAEAGFGSAQAITINTFWDRHISGDEKKRLNKLEFLDEVEEWHLFGDHYCLALGIKCNSDDALGQIAL